MTKRKKDAISKKPVEAPLKKPARFKATAEEARTRTAKVKETFATMGKLWWELGAEVKACIDDFVPEALGRKATEWMKECFGDAWLKVYRAHRAIAALPGVPKAKLEKISEGNAYQLARLPAQARRLPVWIDRAIKLPNEEFKAAVDKVRESKGEKREPMVKWNEIFRITSVPKTLAKVMRDALELAGKNGEFDLDTKEGRINAIELIFAEFITSQAQVQQKQEREIIVEAQSGEGTLEQVFDPTPIDGDIEQAQEILQEAELTTGEVDPNVLETPKSKKRKRASAA
jgi:hypothetical protein